MHLGGAGGLQVRSVHRSAAGEEGVRRNFELLCLLGQTWGDPGVLSRCEKARGRQREHWLQGTESCWHEWALLGL